MATKHYKPTWQSTWTYSYSQLSLYRLCPRRYMERYILCPPEMALVEPMTPEQVYSSLVIHPAIEAFHANTLTPETVTLSINQFRGHDSMKNLDTGAWDIRLTNQILESYKLNPLPEPEGIEAPAFMKIDDIVTGEINKYQFMTKPDFVTADATADLKFTTSPKHYALMPFNDQMLGQAIGFKKKKFMRYQICVNKKDMTLEDVVVEEHVRDDLLTENWFQRTLKTMRDIEESRRTNLWVEHEQACKAFGKPCPYLGSCVYGRIR